MNETFAKILFRSWPFAFGHTRVMNWISPPHVKSSSKVSKLRGFSVMLKYDPNSYIGRYIYYRGIFEEQLIHKIASFTQPGMTFLDIGANIGVHTCIAASLVGKNGRVIAVEPQTKVRAVLKENIALNYFNNVDIVDCALGREQGIGEIYLVNSKNDGEATLVPKSINGTYPSEKVSIAPLGSLLERFNIDKVDIVKIDVEGAEMEVLIGAQDFFKSSPPNYIFIECVDRHLQRFGASGEELIFWLKSNGYKVYGLMGGRWVEPNSASAFNVDLMAIR